MKASNLLMLQKKYILVGKITMIKLIKYIIFPYIWMVM